MWLLWKIEKQWHGVPVPPRTRKVLEALLRKLAPAVLLSLTIYY